MLKFKSATLVISILLMRPCMGADKNEYDYPELNVTPRASDRVETEAARESQNRFGTFIPFQVSALATTAAAIIDFDPSSPAQSYVGLGVGGAWLVLSTVLEFTYSPYSDAAKMLANMPKHTPREILARERAAEEQIKSAAEFAERLKWFSVVTNLGVSIYMITRDGNFNSNFGNYGWQGIAPVGSALLALTPLLFRSPYQEILDQQNDYKKRIYAPVASATLLSEPGTHKVVPGLSLALRF